MGARSRRGSLSRDDVAAADGVDGGVAERRQTLRRSMTSRDLIPPLPNLQLGSAVATALAGADTDDSAVPWIGAEELVPVADEEEEGGDAADDDAAAEGEGEDSSDASDDEYVDGRRRRTYLAYRGKGSRPTRPEQPPADADDEQSSTQSPSRLRRMPTQAAMDREKGELPVLMLKVVTSSTLPVDLGFVTVFPASHMYVFTPCIYVEQRREVTEVLGMSAAGEEVQCKVVEVLPSLQGRGLLGTKGPKAPKDQ